MPIKTEAQLRADRNNLITRRNQLLRTNPVKTEMFIPQYDVIIQDIIDSIATIGGGAAGLTSVLQTDPTTSGEDIQISDGDIIGFNRGSGGTLNSAPTSINQQWLLPDNTGTIALTSDITTPDFDAVLSVGNSTIGNDINITSGDSIVFNNTGNTATINEPTLGGNIVLTLPNTTGTFALTSDLPITTTDTTEGIIELATQTEVNTGTDTVRAVTPDTLEDKTYGTFSGSTISDNVVIKTALQELETAVESALDGNGIYDGSDTIPSSVIATLTDTLTFDDGNVIIKGAGTTNTTQSLTLKNSSGDNYMNAFDNGNVNFGFASGLNDRRVYINADGFDYGLYVNQTGTSGTQRGMQINTTGAATNNRALSISCTGAGTNYAIYADSGNVSINNGNLQTAGQASVGNIAISSVAELIVTQNAGSDRAIYALATGTSGTNHGVYSIAQASSSGDNVAGRFSAINAGAGDAIGLWVNNGTTRIDGDIDHNGSNVGLFGANPVGQAADWGALTDNISGADNNTLDAIPDPADTPITADALRDDLVANVLPEIRDALTTLAARINDVRDVHSEAAGGIGLTA